MMSFPKVRTLWVLGVMLVCCGALFHSHAESWAISTVATNLSSTGKMGVLDYSLKGLFQDVGIAMMALGAISFTMGLIGWLYPPHGERSL